ncbi:carbohydrate-binding domain-containing protein, partial [Bifidobacterium amazonense]|nr:carbohydrate-binding domain-containing protein [Bifidobacterium amazonense]
MVTGGTFQGNTSNTVGGAVHSGGSLTVTGGTFTGNTAKGNGGGALSNDNEGTLTVTGGTFNGNKATSNADWTGGGAIHATGSTTIITGGLFTGNGQDPGACSVDVGSNTQDNCYGGPYGGQAGGGAIYSIDVRDNENHVIQSASLTIQGDVKFRGNYAKARDFGSGGGAVWARGKMWIRNSADASATKPAFEGNWAAIDKPAGPYDTNIQTMLTGPATQITAGGAGGAVFLMNGSTAFITGGEYKNNASGYLGGAIYTEENTTTYVGRAVAWSNTAGHFGGGLWFCPSGNSAASKGGNIALFDNKVNDQLDANTDNRSTVDTQDKTAGSDLAIMNPYHKSRYRIRSNTFQLMDTWFTSRDSSTVEWYWDGVPALKASGYQDKWLGGDTGQSVSTYNGQDGHANRYDENSTNNEKIGITAADNHSVTTCLYYT